MSPGCDEAQLERLRTAVAHAFGLRVEDDRLPELSATIRRALARSGIERPEDYVERLRHAPPTGELADLATQLTVAETYFFRNTPQIGLVQAELGRLANADGGGHLRVLSAGCSTGEEPYSVAMLALEELADPARVAILGVDLNPDALRRARRARYGPWSLRAVGENRRLRHFTKRAGVYAVKDAARRLVRFEQANLADPAARLGGPYHVVLCRNVLMYFVPEVARAVVTRLHDALVPSGLLLLGDAENLRGLSTSFELCHADGAFCYRRRSILRHVVVRRGVGAAVEAPAPHRPAARPTHEALQRAALEVRELDRLVSHQGDPPRGGREREPALADPATPSIGDAGTIDDIWASFREERYEEALATLAVLPSSPDADLELLRAVLLMNAGRMADARLTCEALLAEDSLHAPAHYLLALCLDEAGDADAAADQDRAAIYLDADFALPHMHLGQLLRRQGDRHRARQELSIALGLLPAEDPTRLLLFGGGFGRDALMDACRAALLSCGEAS